MRTVTAAALILVAGIAAAGCDGALTHVGERNQADYTPDRVNNMMVAFQLPQNTPIALGSGWGPQGFPVSWARIVIPAGTSGTREISPTGQWLSVYFDFTIRINNRPTRFVIYQNADMQMPTGAAYFRYVSDRLPVGGVQAMGIMPGNGLRLKYVANLLGWQITTHIDPDGQVVNDIPPGFVREALRFINSDHYGPIDPEGTAAIDSKYQAILSPQMPNPILQKDAWLLRLFIAKLVLIAWSASDTLSLPGEQNEFRGYYTVAEDETSDEDDNTVGNILAGLITFENFQYFGIPVDLSAVGMPAGSPLNGSIDPGDRDLLNAAVAPRWTVAKGPITASAGGDRAAANADGIPVLNVVLCRGPNQDQTRPCELPGNNDQCSGTFYPDEAATCNQQAEAWADTGVSDLHEKIVFAGQTLTPVFSVRLPAIQWSTTLPDGDYPPIN